MTDEKTIEVYNAKVDDYQKMMETLQEDKALTSFMEALPSAVHVLDLGCGPAISSSLMRQSGFTVDPVDASPAMVKLANDQFDIGARLATFDDIYEQDVYHGVWANFSLLHASEEEFPTFLAAINTALKPGGLFHIGMKTGDGSQRDALGRMYTFYTEKALVAYLNQAGFEIISTTRGEDPGLAGTLDPWASMLSRKQ